MEDKLIAHKIELKPFTLNLDLSELHRNRDLPSAFVCYMGVVDSTLPLKGTAHRVVRGSHDPESSGVNMFPSQNEKPEMLMT